MDFKVNNITLTTTKMGDKLTISVNLPTNYNSYNYVFMCVPYGTGAAYCAKHFPGVPIYTYITPENIVLIKCSGHKDQVVIHALKEEMVLYLDEGEGAKYCAKHFQDVHRSVVDETPAPPAPPTPELAQDSSPADWK
jgi:hypothetical protein